MTATKVCAIAAHNKTFALVGMLVTDALRHATKMAWGGVASGRFPNYTNGGQGQDAGHSVAHKNGRGAVEARQSLRPPLRGKA